MSRPLGYRNQNTCRSCKFVYHSTINCYCLYDDHLVLTPRKPSIEVLEQLDEFNLLDETNYFYHWASDNLVTEYSVCDLHREESEGAF